MSGTGGGGRVPEAILEASKLVASGDLAAAVRILEQGDSSSAEIQLNLGALYRALGDASSAARAVLQAVALQPEWPEAHYNLGNVRAGRHEWDLAIEAYETALALRPDWPDALNALGVAQLGASRFPEAQIALERARALAPQWPLPSYNLGRGAAARGDFETAEAMFRDAVTRAPDFAAAHLDHGVMLLLRGDYEHGWPEYEWRWRAATHGMPFDSALLWDGSPLNGRTILLWQEQGLGDAIQFIRYAPLLARDGRVVVMADPALVRLFESVRGVDAVIARGDPLPPAHVHLPMLSLPSRFATRLETIPDDVPYVHARENDRVRAAALIPDGLALRAGVVWQSGTMRPDHASRDCPPALIASLAGDGIVLYNLQHGVPAVALPFRNLPTGDFAFAAALVERMDLVITVDTAVAHLAGALGKTVFLMLGSNPDWRWLRNGESSPWYPTMRLFRRTHGWEDVVADVRSELDALRADYERAAFRRLE